MTPEQWEAYCEPLEWQGHQVYSRSAKQTGFVYGSHQNGSHPDQNRIMVRFDTPTRHAGRLSHGQPSHLQTYMLDEARADLIPDVTHLIREEPFLPTQADNLENQ